MKLAEIALKAIPVSDYLKLRYKLDHVNPKERTLIMRAAQEAKIDLQGEMSPTHNPAVIFLRPHSASIPLDTYVEDRKLFVGQETEELGELLEDENLFPQTEQVVSKVEKFNAELVILNTIAQAMPKK